MQHAQLGQSGENAHIRRLAGHLEILQLREKGEGLEVADLAIIGTAAVPPRLEEMQTFGRAADIPFADLRLIGGVERPLTFQFSAGLPIGRRVSLVLCVPIADALLHEQFQRETLLHRARAVQRPKNKDIWVHAAVLAKTGGGWQGQMMYDPDAERNLLKIAQPFKAG